jgi:hypothetical protein
LGGGLALIDYRGLLVVAVAAFVAPLLARQIPRRLVPPVVLEVVVGILIGPQVLDLVKPRGAAEVLYLLGLGFLLFLAGLDVRPERFRGPTFRLAGSAFLVSAVLAVPVAFGLRAIASGADVRLLALCLVASTLGVLVPVLRDAGEITTDFGQLMVVAGSVGEFGSLLLLTILFSAQPESTTVQVLYVLAMGAAAVVIAVLLRKLWRTRWMARTFADSDEDTSQLRVRGAFVTLMVFTALAHQFGGAGGWPAAGHHAHLPGRGGRARDGPRPAQLGQRRRADRRVTAVGAAVPGSRADPPALDPRQHPSAGLSARRRPDDPRRPSPRDSSLTRRGAPQACSLRAGDGRGVPGGRPPGTAVVKLLPACWNRAPGGSVRPA